MPLRISIGQSSVMGPRPRNEDYAGVVTPNDERLVTKGALVAVADGVSGNAGGREAAEMTVRSVLSDYYATPDTWETHAALDKVLSAANRWVLAQAAANRDLAGMATTLSLLVLRGQRYYLAHVGDTRIYRLREHKLEQLTTDHVWDRPDMRHVLKRAVGLDQHLAIDFAEGDIQVGDTFALMTDGVWDVVSEYGIHSALALFDNPQLICEQLTKQAMSLIGQDNATVVVVKVHEIGEDTLYASLADAKSLPLPPKLKVGELLDGFEILGILHESRASILYQIRNSENGQHFVLKTLQPQLANDLESCQGLMNEEWLAKRVVSNYIPQVLPLPLQKRRYLYYVMSMHQGATLQQQVTGGHHFTVNAAASIGADLMRGLGILHRLNIIHRDIKPDNVHIGHDRSLRILDLGVALNPITSHASASHANDSSIDAQAWTQNPGTPSFMAPELFEGTAASARTDIYAAGVTLYYLLTRRYPYGEIEPFQHPRFGEPVPPTRYRPEIPSWLENILLKAVAREPAARFETAEEMLLALEHGELRPILAPQRTPLIARARLVKWQWLTIFSLIVNFLLMYLLLIS